MKTRRPNILLFNDWISECVNHLDHSPHMTDRHLAAWFGLQRIVDEAMSSFGLDDTSCTATLTEARIQAILRWFDDRMQAWKKNTSPDLLTGGLPIGRHILTGGVTYTGSFSAYDARVSPHEPRSV